jgi:hypothetical protein
MCVSEALNGRFNIKGDCLSALKSNLSEFLDGSSQNYQQNSTNITYISRLQCLKAAIESYICHISKVSPRNKIGVVTFNTTPNVSRFLVPVFVGLFYYYNIANLTLGTYFKLEKNNYEIEYCYRKLGTTSTHFGEKFSLMA